MVLVLIVSTGCTNKITRAVFADHVAAGTIVVEDNKKLEQTLISELARQRKSNRTLGNVKAPRRRAKIERELLAQRLQANGYYRANIQTDIHKEGPRYQVVPGPQYTIERIELDVPSNISSVDRAVLGLKQGDVLYASKVLQAQKALETKLREKECLFDISVTYDALVIHPRASARVKFSIKPSPQATFGKLSFEGLEKIDQDYLRGRQPIRSGDCFKRNTLDKARLSLLRTNLVLSAVTNITPPENVNQIEEPVSVPVHIIVRERDHRTLSAGLLYDSDEGAGLSLGWEHRNLWGRAQKLDLDAYIAQRDQNIQGRLTIPHFRREDQALAFTSSFRNQETDAFESNEGSFGAEISRQLRRNMRGFIGLNLDFYRVLENDEKEDFALLSIPLSFEFDRRSDPLDPKQGWVAGGRLRPYWDTLNSDVTFLKNTFATSGYHTFERIKTQPTLAARTAFGSIEGARQEDIPANVRFYVGGGGSVRGYPFQSVGPVDEDFSPLGGLSFTEVSVELRSRFSESWGAAIFLDGGSAFAKELPDFGEELLWAAGAGVRFFTSFAPIRFDVAIPLDDREDIDDSFQIYISIGQSF